MNIILAGGSGMLGEALSGRLLEIGHSITILSRSQRSSVAGLDYSRWNPATGEVDEELFSRADAVINLAGAPIAQRWTTSARKAIIESRVQSTELLTRTASSPKSTVKIFINASAIGYYEPGEEWRTESDPSGTHFMARVCAAWENACSFPAESTIRKAVVRIGVVLGDDGGALKAMQIPFKLGLGAALGSGKQYMSLIHQEDLCNLFVFILENERVQGVYNAVMPECPTNKVFSKALAEALNRPFFLPALPAFLLRLVLGETAESVLLSFRVSSQKAVKDGFSFKYVNVSDALKEIYQKR